jgi:SOS-response transcriptional repressor LexA
MTPRQLEALDFVRDRITLAGFAPTVREIGRHLGVSSLSSVARLLEGLSDAGHIRLAGGRHRGIELTGQPDLRTASLDAIRAELARRGETLESLQAHSPVGMARHARCAADTCGAPVQRGRLFCLAHWRALPGDLQRDLLAAHRRGDRRAFQELLVQARDIADGCGGVL